MVFRAASSHRVALSVSRLRRGKDVWAVSLLVLLTCAAEAPLLVGGTVVGVDSAPLLLPMYSFLGERLRSGDIPMWNPYNFSGTPFAADPQSGWMYFLAMALFPLELAAQALMLLHLLVAGLSLYALARTVGLTVAGSLLATLAYQYSSFAYERNACCYAFMGVLTWLPLLLLCTELAIRARNWRPRVSCPGSRTTRSRPLRRL